MTFYIELLLLLKNTLHSGDLFLQTLLHLLKCCNRRLTRGATRNRRSGCLHSLFGTEITFLNQIKATPHDCAAANRINDLSIHLPLKLHPKMFKHPSQQEPVLEIMRSSSVCNSSNVLDHESVDLLASVHEICETLIHSIILVARLPSRDDVLTETRVGGVVTCHPC